MEQSAHSVAGVGAIDFKSVIITVFLDDITDIAVGSARLAYRKSLL